MQRNRNRNINANNIDHKHIIVTGFSGEKQVIPAKKPKLTNAKTKAANDIKKKA
jgi:hypothetical protein